MELAWAVGWMGNVSGPCDRYLASAWTLARILDGFKGRQHNFHKWARPAYEQGALPTLSLLPGDVIVRVLPGDKIYQAMEIEQGFMRPAILHGFGTSAKQRLPTRLAELAQFGWLPLAAALFGTVTGSRNGYIIIFSLLLGCGFMRRFHRPRSPISKWCRCLVCGSEELF